MLYAYSGAEFIQERGKEKQVAYNSSIGFNSFGFDYSNTHFPMCTSDYILYALYPEYSSDYTQQYQYLLLAPPMNAYSIRQREYDQYSMQEFFLHFDEKYVVRMKRDYISTKVDICMLNGKTMQTVEIAQNGQFMPIVSESGEYIVAAFMIPPNEQDTPYKVPDPAATDNSAVGANNVNSYSSYYANQQVNAPSFKVYKIRRTDEYKKKILGSSNQDNKAIDRSELKNIVLIEMIKKYDVPHELIQPGYYGDDSSIFNQLYSINENIKYLHVDNKGSMWFINPERKCFLHNNVNLWNDFMKLVEQKLGTFDKFKFLKFGQENIFVNKDDIIMNIKFDNVKNSFSSVKELSHKAINIKGCSLERIVAPRALNYLLLFYRIEKSMTIVAWDLENDIEHSNFSSKGLANFTDYMIGKSSKLGFACFSKYIVNLDTGIPIPFISKTNALNPSFWNQGLKMNSTEEMIVSCGEIITPVCQRDIYYHKNPSFDSMDYRKFVYYLDKKSAVFEYLDDPEKLDKIFKLFDKKDNKLYLMMILLQNSDGKTALDVAIENNYKKSIEIMLEALIHVSNFSLSKAMYKNFSELLNMNLKIFEEFLNTCYFKTFQMKEITKADLKEKNKIVREASNCCILDTNFYRKYKIPDAQGNLIISGDSKPNGNAVVPIVNQNNNSENNKSDSNIVIQQTQRSYERVMIKAIEFDWIFNTKEGEDFLGNLADTENIKLFGVDIIKDVILLQWSYFKMHIIGKLLLPYLLYFIIFLVHVTYVIKNEHYESSNETKPYHVTAWVLGSIILIFNVYWAYVEFTQMIFHKIGYFKSFWNLLDLSSVIMNTAVIIMEFSSASFDNINRVSAVSVLILYFKVFYYLRIFFETGYQVRMMIEIVIDMKNFVIVLMLAVFAFGNSYYILGRNSDDSNFVGIDIAAAFIYSWRIGVGDSDTSKFNTRDEEVLKIIFVLNLIIVLIMLLNLVVAIMGNTFDRVKQTQEFATLQELTQMIQENEFMFSRKRHFKNAKYIMIIEPEKAEEEGSSTWEGEVNMFKSFAEETSNTHINNLQKLSDKVGSLAKIALDEGMDIFQEKFNSKLSTINEKLETMKTKVGTMIECIQIERRANGKDKNIPIKNKRNDSEEDD